MKIFKIFFASLMVSVLCLAQNAESIEKLITFEKLTEAKSSALAWVQKEPANAEAYLWAGKVFLAAKNVDSASLFFNKGFEVNPKNPYNLAGKISVAFLKDNAAAVPALVEQAKDIASRKDARLYIELAAAFLNAKSDADRAQLVAFTDEAIKYDRKNYRIYIILGDYYVAQPQTTSQAVENYQKAVDYDKGALRAYIQRAKVYENVDNISEAYDQYKKAIRADATFPVAYQKLAEMFYRVHDWVGADTTYDLYMKYTEPSFDKLKRSVTISYSAKNFKSAIEKANQVLAIDPKDYAYQRALAYSYFEIGDSVAALSALETFMQNADSVKNARDYNRYAKTLQKFGKDSLAALAYKNEYLKDTTKSEPLSEAGKIYNKQKKWKDLVSVLDPKINKFAEASDALDYFNLGRAYYFDSLYVQAKEVFEKMTAKYTTYSPAYYWLSLSCVAINSDAKTGLAKSAYEKFIQYTPDTVKYKRQLVDAHSYLAIYYFNNENKEQSKAEWTIVLGLDPENAQASLYMKELNK